MARFVLLSLRYQPPTLTGCEVVLYSSIMSPPGVVGLANTSLMTTEPGKGIGVVSAVPGVPFGDPTGLPAGAGVPERQGLRGTGDGEGETTPWVCGYQELW